MNRMIAALVLCPLWACAQEAEKGRIAGKVVDSVTLAPLRKATVMLLGSGGNRPQRLRTNSDAEGNFSFENLSEGVYELRGEKTAYLNTIYGSRPSGNGGSPISLGKGEVRKDLLFKLIPQAAISGRVVDGDGDPLDRVDLTLLRRISQDGRLTLYNVANGQSNDRGEFRLAGIAPGKYLLSLERTGGLDSIPAQRESTGTAYPPVFFPGVASVIEAQEIQLDAGQELASLSLSLRRTKVFHIRGRFVGRSADTLSRPPVVSVQPKGTDHFDFQSALLNPKDDSFAVYGLTPGTYTISIVVLPPNANLQAGKLDVTIADSNLDGIEVYAISMASLNCKVRVEGDITAIELRKLAIGLLPVETGRNPIPVQYKEGGHFEALGLAPKKYYLVPEMKNQSFYLKSILAGGKPITDGILDLSGGAGMEVDLLVSTKVGQIEGIVEKESTATSFAAVLLVPVSGGRQIRAKLESSGKFSAPNLGPGEYLLYALEEYEPALFNPAILPKLASKAVKINLNEGETKSITVKQITWEELEMADK